MPRLDTASTTRIAPVERVTAAMPFTSWSTPVDDSLCCISTAFVSGCSRSARAKVSAGTVWPKGASSGITVTPWVRQISSQRSPNLPARSTRTVSPADRVLTTAASIAPVPEDVNGITSWLVWKSRLSPARTSMKSASYSGVRWWIIGWAMASRTFEGTGVGPGAIR